jgi:hypothetical protein
MISIIIFAINEQQDVKPLMNEILYIDDDTFAERLLCAAKTCQSYELSYELSYDLINIRSVSNKVMQSEQMY